MGFGAGEVADNEEDAQDILHKAREGARHAAVAMRNNGSGAERTDDRAHDYGGASEARVILDDVV